MQRTIFWSLVLLAATGWSGRAQTPAPDAVYQTAHRQLKEMEARGGIAAVKDLVIRRDAGTLVLESGELALCSPVNGLTCAAVFRGKGRFLFEPPDRVERQQLARFYNSTSLDHQFPELFLLFADGTLDELKGLSFDKPPDPAGFQPVIDEAVSFLTHNHGLRGRYCRREVMKSLLEGRENGFFLAHLRASHKGQPEMFEINPYHFEEVGFYRYEPCATLTTYRYELISNFHWRADSLEGGRDKGREPLNVLGYRMDCRISGEKGVEVACQMKVRPNYDGDRWLQFELFSAEQAQVLVDSVVWQDGSRLYSYKGEEIDEFWVQVPEPLKKDGICSLKVFYHGDMMERFANWVSLRSPSGWYPSSWIKERSAFDVTYHYPSRFRFVSVGDQVACDTLADMVNSRWVVPAPVQFFTFNMGYFKENRVGDDRIPPVTILTSDEIRVDHKQVAADVANSLLFYQQVFGPCPASRLAAVQYQYGGGVAFPGLINLAWSTFKNNQRRYMSYQEALRAHEVVHQWWGYGVDHKTYHDQWLSEGLSEFSGLWYMQVALKDNKNYFRWLKEYRDDIVNNRQFLLADGKGSGPIWLGRRNITSETYEDNAVITYEKGAWVIHMLRNMLMDMNTMKEDKFIAMLKDYYATYRDSLVTTEQFRRVAEKHAGIDLGWFFEQWVYGTDIPSYKYCYSSRQTPEGKHQVTFRVRQEGVANDFRMYVPLLIDFGGDRSARLRIMVKGPESVIELPPLPLPPKKIEFNPYWSVLCQWSQEDF